MFFLIVLIQKTMSHQAGLTQEPPYQIRWPAYGSYSRVICMSAEDFSNAVLFNEILS